jgi:hypothetical protein
MTSIRPEQLFPLDQSHYYGTDAIRAAFELLGLGPASRVLDIGAGVGGPARYLAHTTGWHGPRYSSKSVRQASARSRSARASVLIRGCSIIPRRQAASECRSHDSGSRLT